MSIKYKILGQQYIGLTDVVIPGGGAYYYYGGGGTAVNETLLPVVLYTVPTGKQAIISSIYVANRDTVNRTYDLAIVPALQTLSMKHHIRWDAPILASDIDVVSSKLTMNAGDSIFALPSTADKIGFTVFGVEVTA
jgi:hypothetical protein